MYLKVVNDIENNIFSTKITVDGFGTDSISEDEEKEMIANFPTKIAYKNLTFTKNVKLDGNEVVVTDEEVGDEVVSVTLPVFSNKEIVIDEKFEAYYKVDSKKIPSGQLNTVLNTPELLSAAYCVIFTTVVKDAVEESLDTIRTKAPAFEGETIYTV